MPQLAAAILVGGRALARTIAVFLALCSGLCSLDAVAAELSCTARVEAQERVLDGLASGPTVEEASELAIENACAVACAPAQELEESGDEPAPTEPKEPAPTEPKEPAPTEPKEPAPTEPAASKGDEASDEAVASDDLEGFEACIDTCTEEGIVIGVQCADASGETVWAEGVFDPDGEGEGEGDDGGEEGDEAKGVQPTAEEGHGDEAP